MQGGRSRVWIAGDSGLLAFSDDTGEHWTKLDYDGSTGTFSVGGTHANTPAQSSMFGVSMRVEAATLAQNAGPKGDNPEPMGAKRQSQGPEKSQGRANPPAQIAPQQILITVPDLVGRTRGVAEKTLLVMGLRLGNVKEDPSGRQSGIVLTQMPKAGTQESTGSYVVTVVGGRRTRPPHPP